MEYNAIGLYPVQDQALAADDVAVLEVSTVEDSDYSYGSGVVSNENE